MFKVDRRDAGDVRADQPNRIVAAADAGFEYGERAFHFLEVQASERELCFECAETFVGQLCRDVPDRGFDSRDHRRQLHVVDRHAVDLEAFVEMIQVRRCEQSGAKAGGAADAGAERRGAAFTVRAGDHDRVSLQPRAIDAERVEQSRETREANAVPVFRQVKHATGLWQSGCGARSAGSDRHGRCLLETGSMDWR